MCFIPSYIPSNVEAYQFKTDTKTKRYVIHFTFKKNKIYIRYMYIYTYKCIRYTSM